MSTTNSDIIIVGGGTAGSVIAARLIQANPNLNITVIEQGPDTVGDDSVKRPLQGMFSALMGSENAKTYISKPDPRLDNREVQVACGNAMGGGSAVNFMIYNQAAASDWDDWKQPGWSFKEMEPYINKPFTHTINRTGDGPIIITNGGHRSPEWMQDFFRAIAETRDMTKLEDMADMTHGDGYGWHAKYIDEKGARCSAATKYLYEPGLDSKINIVRASVDRVLFDGDQVTGVEYQGNTAHAPQVILCAGALGSGPILERSGIGKREILEVAGVDVKVELDVGNLKDHQKLLLAYHVDDVETLDGYLNLDDKVLEAQTTQWLTDGTGQVATNGINMGIKWNPTEAEITALGSEFRSPWESIAQPDKALVTIALACHFIGDRRGLDRADKFMTFGMWTNYPESTGSIHITADGLDFDAGLLHSDADMAVLVHSYKWTREIARRMSSFRGEYAPGHPNFASDSDAALTRGPCQVTRNIQYTPEDDAKIEEWIRENVNTCWHSMGSCPMRSRNQGGVVDANLDVYGVKGLKVADLSVTPGYMGTNTASTALAIGEKCASLL